MVITALKSDPQKEIHYHNIIWQPVLLFQSLHYPWCRFLIFAETCAILQSLLSQEKLHQHLGSSKKNSAGRKKSHGKHIQFLFWFIALCNYNNQRALPWCADIQVQADLFSCHTVKVVIASCSLLIGVCVPYLYVHAIKHFVVQKWTRLGNECWCLQGGSAVGNVYKPNIWLWDCSEFSVKKTEWDLVPRYLIFGSELK